MSNYQHQVVINLDEQDREKLMSADDFPLVMKGCPRFDDDNSPDFDFDTLYPGDVISFTYALQWADGYTEFVVIFYPEGCEIISLPSWKEIVQKHTGNTNSLID